MKVAITRNLPVGVKTIVRKRDRNMCRKCHYNKHLEFHHIIPFGDLKRSSKYYNIVNKPSNIILLCKKTH